jgi:molybdopterin synthase catalytic subunit
MLDIALSDQPLSVDQCYAKVQDPTCGGICLFVGTIRNHSQGEPVTHLEFDSYPPMAIKEMRRIAEEAQEKFGLQSVVVHHRVGHMSIGDIAVIIAVSSAHRAAAFEGCEWVIDELKKDVPIWKKEFRPDGSYWVNARP